MALFWNFFVENFWNFCGKFPKIFQKFFSKKWRHPPPPSAKFSRCVSPTPIQSPPGNNSVFEASGLMEVARFSPSEILPVEVVPWQTPPRYLGAQQPPLGRGPPPPRGGCPPGQLRGPLPSSVWTRHGAVKQGQSGGPVGTTPERKGGGCREVRRGRIQGWERPLGPTAYGGERGQ